MVVRMSVCGAWIPVSLHGLMVGAVWRRSGACISVDES